MLSDTLFDAARSIKHYQENFPAMYDEHKPEIENIVRLMDDLRVKLDSPDSLEILPNYKKNLENS